MDGGSAATRRLILLWVGVFVAGGAWQAYQALRVNRDGLPLRALEEAGRLAPPAGQPASQLACSPRLRLTLVQFAVEPRLLLDGDELCESHLQPRLAAQPLLPPANLSAVALLHPPPPPPGLLRRMRAAVLAGKGAQLPAPVRQKALKLGSQLLQLALDTHQLPSPSAEAADAAVLVYVAGAGEEDSAAAGAGSGGGSGSAGAAAADGSSGGGSASASGGAAVQPTVTAVELEEGVLAVFVTGAAWDHASPQQEEEQGQQLQGQQDEQQEPVLRLLADIAADWLGARVVPPGTGADGLAAACLAGAGAQLQQLLAALRALPDMPTSPEFGRVAAHAARAVTDAQHAQQQGEVAAAAAAGDGQRPLRLAREAWAAAQATGTHPGFGLDQVFPKEHQIAVVLPISLPVLLVVLRAVAREVADWRRQRQGPAAAAAAAAAKGPKAD